MSGDLEDIVDEACGHNRRECNVQGNYGRCHNGGFDRFQEYDVGYTNDDCDCEVQDTVPKK